MRWSASLLIALLIPATPVAQAQSTLLSMSSEAGDYIGGGQDYLYRPGDGTFTIRRNFGNGVSISFDSPTLGQWWYLDFAGPHEQLLTVGLYQNAVRYPFQPPELPGLSVSGTGRGCNTLTGSFEVLEIMYGSDDEIVAFRARFEQHCEGLAPALRGEIRFNATVPIELDAPTHVSVLEGANLSFQVSATELSGGSVVLSTTGMPFGASFTDNGNNTGTFSWTPAPGQAASYLVGFHGANSSGATESIFTRITVVAPAPPNDDFDNAAPVILLPFTVTQNTAGATAAVDDPFCGGSSASVWFAYTPQESMRIEADTFGSSYDTTLSVHTGARGSLVPLACNDNAEGTLQSRVRFDATAGVTYFFVVTAFAGGTGGSLTFNVHEGPPPLSIDASVYRLGSVSLTSGVGQLSGSVSCSRPGFVSVAGELRQVHAGMILSGFFSAFVPCGGTEAWTADVFVLPGLFRGRAAALLVAGPATVTATVFGFDPESGEFVQRNFVAEVILQGGR